MKTPPEEMQKIRDMVQELLSKKINGMEDKLDAVCDELAEIKRLLAGDKKYNIEGMKQRQDEMWKNHMWWRENQEDVKELLVSYRNWRWLLKNLDKWVTFIGVGTIISIIVGILNLAGV